MNENSRIKDLLEKAWASRREGEYTKAKKLVDKAHDLCGDEDYDTLGRIFHVCMQFEADHGAHAKALELSRESVMYYKKSGNPYKVAHSMRHMADLECRLEKLEDAERNYREVIDLYRASPNTAKGNLANALRGFALLLEKIGNIQEAREIWTETKELYRDGHIQDGVDEANQKIQELDQSSSMS